VSAASWTKELADNSTFVAAMLGGLAAFLVVASSLRQLYRRTIGRRHDRYERLARLGAGSQLSFFIAVHGEPPAIRATVTKPAYELVTREHELWDPHLADDVDEAHEVLIERSYQECIFVDPFYYLQTITDEDDTVLAFSVTTRRRRFRPVFAGPAPLGLLQRLRLRRDVGEWSKPLFLVRLGKTRFSELDPPNPDDFAGPHFRASPAARFWAYSEFNYYGNPGLYLTYVFTASSNAPGPAGGSVIFDVVAQAGYHEWPYPTRPDPSERAPPDPGTEPEWDSIPAAHKFRRRTAITTITMIHSRLWLANFPTTFGPHGDEVRLLR
jgi:hypothetical protein